MVAERMELLFGQAFGSEPAFVVLVGQVGEQDLDRDITAEGVLASLIDRAETATTDTLER